MLAWTDANFRLILQNWGTIIYISPFVDNEDRYINPKILVETEIKKNLEFDKMVKIENQLYNISVVESGDPSCSSCNAQRNSWPVNDFRENSLEATVEDAKGTDIDLNAEENSNLKVQSPVLDFKAEPNKTQSPGSRDSHPSKIDPQRCSKPQCEVTNLKSSEINPLVVYEPDITSKLFNENENWQWRSWDSTEEENSQIFSESSQLVSVLDDSNGQDFSDRADSQFSFLKDLRELRIKSKRGRPRKNLKKKENKAFKIPFRRRSRKNGAFNEAPGLPAIIQVDEANAILETGILLGLTLEKDKVSSIAEIKKRLNV